MTVISIVSRLVVIAIACWIVIGLPTSAMKVGRPSTVEVLLKNVTLILNRYIQLAHATRTVSKAAKAATTQSVFAM